MITAFGHSRLASESDMPARSPKRRASYEHDAITPAPTITGLPLSRGSRCCSIAAKNASMSTCRTVRASFGVALPGAGSWALSRTWLTSTPSRHGLAVAVAGEEAVEDFARDAVPGGEEEVVDDRPVAIPQRQ